MTDGGILHNKTQWSFENEATHLQIVKFDVDK